MNQRLSSRRARRGTVLIMTMLIAFALAGVAITLGRTARVELGASANMVASIQAAGVERGAEQYIMALLIQQTATQAGVLPDVDQTYYKEVPVGEGYFWVVRPQYGDNSMPDFGLVDESSKLNINTTTTDSLMRLPNMTNQIADAIVAYRGAGGTGTSSSPQSSGGGYYVKNAPYETVEELLLVSQDVTREWLYGNGTGTPLGEQTGGLAGAGTGAVGRAMTDQVVARGMYDYLTIYSVETAAAATSTTGGATGGAAGGKININQTDQRDRLRTLLLQQLGNTRGGEIANAISPRQRFLDVFDFYFQTKLKADEFDKIAGQLTTATGATSTGRINVNTAPREVLLTIPGLEAADVDKLISSRPSSTSSGLGTSASTTASTSIAWVATALERKSIGLGEIITGSTSRVSADIVAVSGNGRSFKRVRVVFDVAGTTPQVIYRRELTDRGWPMDPQILASLRAGQGVSGGGRTTVGVGGLNR